MTHTLDEIKKMLKEITVWPVMEVGAGPIIIDCHEIISELVEEVEYWQKRHADEYHAGYKDGYDEAKHGAEARYSLAKELREQVQLLMNKNKELEPAAFAFTLSQYSDRDPMRNEIYRLMKDAQERQKVKKPSS